jgi:hypothetical protein
MRPLHTSPLDRRAAIERLLAVPYLDEGRDEAGADCFGIFRLFYRDVFGVLLDEFAGVRASDFRSVSRTIGTQKTAWPKVDLPRFGDAVVMRGWTERSTIPDLHLGVVLDRRGVLHSERPIGCRVESLRDPQLAARVIEFRRHPDAA